jgi:hypothetical protein
MKFSDPGLDAFLGHEVRFNFNTGGTAYRVGPEAKANSWISLSFRSPQGTLIRLGLSGHSVFAGREMAWDLRIGGDPVSSGGDTKSITDKTLRLLVERALAAFSQELARRGAANRADQQRRAAQATKRV